MPKGAVNQAKRLEVSRLKFAELIVPEDHEFCCVTHRAIFFEMQEKAANGTYTEKMRDFALAIFKGTNRCVANEEVSVRCVHSDLVNKKQGRKILRDENGDPLKTLKRCDAVITDTRLHIAEFKSLCPKHRTK